MEQAIANNKVISRYLSKKLDAVNEHLNLSEAAVNVTHVIKGVNTSDQSMKDYLFTLGCYEGETVTVISVLAENYIINIKDARYSIDEGLARAILV